jgi:hypothetical protein
MKIQRLLIVLAVVNIALLTSPWFDRVPQGQKESQHGHEEVEILVQYACRVGRAAIRPKELDLIVSWRVMEGIVLGSMALHCRRCFTIPVKMSLRTKI